MKNRGSSKVKGDKKDRETLIQAIEKCLKVRNTNVIMAVLDTEL